MTADLSRLNGNKPFQKYFNPKEKTENFKKEHDPKEERKYSEMPFFRKLGRFRKHVKDNYGMIVSVNDIANFLEKQTDEELVWKLISKKDSAAKNFINLVKNKRFT